MKDESPEEAGDGDDWMTLVQTPDWTRDAATRFTTVAIPYLMMSSDHPKDAAQKTMVYFRETQKLLRELDQTEGEPEHE